MKILLNHAAQIMSFVQPLSEIDTLTHFVFS